MQYRGYDVPVFNPVRAMEQFNGQQSCWCNGATDCHHTCEDCLLCANYGNRRAKIRLFALWALEHGCAVTRDGVDLSDLIDVHHGHKFICNTCGEIHTMPGGGIGGACISCRTRVHTDDRYICTHCGRIVSDVFTPEDDESIHMCSCCATTYLHRCARCGVFTVGLLHTHVDGRPMCDRCLSLYRPCHICGQMTVRADIQGNAICSECLRESEWAVQSYSFKPRPRFYGDASDGVPYLGVELESGDADAEDHDKCVLVLRDLSERRFYLKHDGSVPEYGFELVTHPCTYEYHADTFPWRDVLSELRKYRFKSYGASKPCGLHVHVSRNALSAFQWIKVDWMVSKHQAEWSRIARRTPNHYCQMKRYRCDISLKRQYGISSDRYQAVNFCNPHTVEFRLFRGSLKYETVIGTLAIVDGLVSWAKHVKMRQIIQYGAMHTFIEHLKSEPKWEPALQYLKTRNLI